MKHKWINEYLCINEHKNFVSCLEFNREGNKILTASHDGTIALFDLTEKSQIHRLKLNIAVKAAAFSEDGKKLLAFTDDKSIHIWNIKTCKKESEFPVVGPKAEYIPGKLGYKYITVASFSPNRTHIALGCQDSIIYIVPISPEARTSRLSGHKMPVSYIGWINEDSIYSAAQSDDHLTIWNRVERTPLLKIPIKSIYSIAAQDPKLATVQLVSRKITIWDTSTGARLKILKSGLLLHEAIESVCFHPEGRHIAAGRSRGSLILWDINEGKSHTYKSAHAGPIDRVGFSGNGAFFASSDRTDFTVKVWKVNI